MIADVEAVDAVEEGEEVGGGEEGGLPGFEVVGFDEEDAGAPAGSVGALKDFALGAFDVDFQEVGREAVGDGLAANACEGCDGDGSRDQVLGFGFKPAGQNVWVDRALEKVGYRSMMRLSSFRDVLRFFAGGLETRPRVVFGTRVSRLHLGRIKRWTL